MGRKAPIPRPQRRLPEGAPQPVHDLGTVLPTIPRAPRLLKKAAAAKTSTTGCSSRTTKAPPKGESCIICLDEIALQQAPFFPSCSRSRACTVPHHMCQPCAAKYITHAMTHGPMPVRCPAAGCHATWCYDDAVAGGLSSTQLHQFQQLTSAGKPRAVEPSDDAEDPGLQDLLDLGYVQRCRRCQAPTIRNGGCPSMTCSRCGTGWRWDVDRTLPEWYRHVPRSLRQPLRCTIKLLQWVLWAALIISVLYGAYQLCSWSSSFSPSSSTLWKIILGLAGCVGCALGGLPAGLFSLTLAGGTWLCFNIVLYCIAGIFSATGSIITFTFSSFYALCAMAVSVFSTLLLKIALPLSVPLLAFVLIAYLTRGKKFRMRGVLPTSRGEQQRNVATGRTQAAAKVRQNAAMRKMDHKRGAKKERQTYAKSNQKWDMRVVASGRKW